MKTIKDLLATHPCFEELAPKPLAFVSGCARNAVYKEEEFLFKEGTEADKFFLIRHGKVSIEVFSETKGEIIIQTVGAGEVVGWSWLFPPYLWHFDAQARESTRVIVFDGKCLREKFEKDHKLGYDFFKRFCFLITRRLIATRMQLLDFYGSPPSERKAK